jgi:DNA polymerase III delta subunit
VDRLAGTLCPDAASVAWNREVVWADSVEPEALVATGADVPLFGGRRLVVVRGVGEAPAKALDRLRAAIEAARARPGGWPADGTTVVLVAWTSGRRPAPLRLVGESDQVEVRGPAGRALAGWLRDRARQAGLELEPEAAQVLLEICGEDLGRLRGELDKALLLVGPDGRVTVAVIRALAGESRVRQYWELGQALEAGDRGGALRVLEDLLRSGEEALAIVAQVVGHVRDVWRAQGGLAQRLDARRAAGLFPRRRPEWAIERLMARGESWGRDGLEQAVARCFEVEARLKSGGGDARGLLTALVSELAARAPAR